MQHRKVTYTSREGRDFGRILIDIVDFFLILTDETSAKYLNRARRMELVEGLKQVRDDCDRLIDLLLRRDY